MAEMNPEGFTGKVIFDSDKQVHNHLKPMEGCWELYYKDYPSSRKKVSDLNGTYLGK